jgi:hypothetical protein
VGAFQPVTLHDGLCRLHSVTCRQFQPSMLSHEHSISGSLDFVHRPAILNAVTSRSIVSGVLKKNDGYGKREMGGLYTTGFVQGRQKLNDRSRKMIHPGIIDRGFSYSETQRFGNRTCFGRMPYSGMLRRVTSQHASVASYC